MKRQYYLDSLKAFAIIMVVYCHYPFLTEKSFIGNIFMLIAWSAVPIFMMVSGNVMNRKKHKLINIVSKIIKMYITICAWRIIYFALTYFFVKRLEINILSIINFIFTFENYPGVNADVMWYMISYLGILMILPIINCLNSNKDGRAILEYLLVICLVFGNLFPTIQYFVKNSYLNNYLGFLSISKLMSIPSIKNIHLLSYYLLGVLVEEFYQRLGKHKVYIPICLVTIGFLGLLLDKYMQDGTLLFVNRSLLDGGYYRLSTMCLAVGLYLMFFKYSIKMNSFNCFISKIIGQNTLGIYYLHFIILAMIAPYLYMYNSFIINVLKTIVVTLVCCLITMIMKKIPFLRELVR